MSVGVLSVVVARWMWYRLTEINDISLFQFPLVWDPMTDDFIYRACRAEVHREITPNRKNSDLTCKQILETCGNLVEMGMHSYR